jgi:parvulin-like peptidyl-prolyl isomerase
VEHLKQEMARRGGGRPGRFATAEERRALLDEMVRERLLIAAARAAGYDRDPEIVAALERLMAAKFDRDRLDEEPAAVEVSDEEIAAAYEADPERYTVPEQVRAGLIVLEVPAGASAERRAELRQQAETILAEVRDVDPARGFGDLARRYSADRASRYVGGVVGWLVRGDRYRWPAEVVEAAFALATAGDAAEVATAKGLYLVRLIERRPAALRPLADVADGIRRELLRRRYAARREAFFAGLRREIAVEVDAAALDEIGPPAEPRPPEMQPPAVADN